MTQVSSYSLVPPDGAYCVFLVTQEPVQSLAMVSSRDGAISRQYANSLSKDSLQLTRCQCCGSIHEVPRSIQGDLPPLLV